MDGPAARAPSVAATPTSTGPSSASGRWASSPRSTLDVEPTYDVRQDVCDRPALTRRSSGHFDEITAAGYSVSLFTDFSGAGFAQAWVKSRAAEAPTEFFGRAAGDRQLHPTSGRWPRA